MKLKDAVEGFILSRSADGYSQNTINIFRNHTRQMLSYFGEERELASITTADLQAFIVWLRTEYKPVRPKGNTAPLSQSSISNAWCTMRSFYGWAEDVLTAGRPDKQIRQPRWDAPEVVPFSREDVEKLIKNARTLEYAGDDRRKAFQYRPKEAKRNEALIRLLLDTGIRASECSRLTLADVNLETGEISVQPWGTGRKTKPRTIPIGASTRKVIWQYIAARENRRPDDPLFITKNDTPIDRIILNHILKRIGDRAGVSNPNPHRFRHTFAIEFLRGGGDIFTLQRLLGHRTLKMVQHYLHLAQSDIAQAHRRASPGDRWKL